MDNATFRSRRFLVLLSTLAVVLAVQSLSQGLAASSIITDVLVILAVLAVFFLVFEHTPQRLAALATAIAAIVITGAHYLLPDRFHVPLAVAYHGLLVLFLGWALVEILRNLFAEKPIRTDDLLGAVCGYVIAGAAWGNLYALSELLVPGAFSVAPAIQGELADWHGRRALFTYFSFTTISSLGYADVTPTRAPATTMALVEVVFGQFYLAVVVAQIVSMRLAQAVKSLGK
ncbi:MAG: ion channel [Burkholderiales bacterium]